MKVPDIRCSHKMWNWAEMIQMGKHHKTKQIAALKLQSGGKHWITFKPYLHLFIYQILWVHVVYVIDASTTITVLGLMLHCILI